MKAFFERATSPLFPRSSFICQRWMYWIAGGGNTYTANGFLVVKGVINFVYFFLLGRRALLGWEWSSQQFSGILTIGTRYSLWKREGRKAIKRTPCYMFKTISDFVQLLMFIYIVIIVNNQSAADVKLFVIGTARPDLCLWWLSEQK